LPINLSGNQVTISGKIHSITIDNAIIHIKGNDPLKILERLTSGVMLLMIYKLSPTGGVINPISMLIVNTIANQ
jgi:hypothetical protein